MSSVGKYDLAEFNNITGNIAAIEHNGNFLPDCSTALGYEQSKRFCLDYTVPARTALTEIHKKTKAPFWNACKLMDDKKRELMEMLLKIEEPHSLAYKAHDEQEKQKKAKFEQSLKDKVQSIIDFKDKAIGKSSDDIVLLIDACSEIETSDGFFKLEGEACKQKADALTALNAVYIDAIKSEAKAEKLKAINEKQIESDYELAWLMNDQFDREALDKIARGKEEAERRRIEEQETAKRNEELAAERAKQQEIGRQEQERKRIEQENKQRAEDKEHVEKTNTAAIGSIITRCDVTQAQAERFIQAVASNEIPHVTIKY